MSSSIIIIQTSEIAIHKKGYSLSKKYLSASDILTDIMMEKSMAILICNYVVISLWHWIILSQHPGCHWVIMIVGLLFVKLWMIKIYYFQSVSFKIVMMFQNILHVVTVYEYEVSPPHTSLCILLKNGLICKELSDATKFTQMGIFECCAVELLEYKITIFCVYRTPKVENPKIFFIN